MELIESLLFILNEMSPYILFGFLIAGVMHAFISSRTMGNHLAGTGIVPVTKAAMIGIPLPLCSCGVLPTAIAMRRSGASRAASTSFLVSTPQTGVDSIAATYSLLGPAFAVIRPMAALFVALGSGMAVGHIERRDSSDQNITATGHKHEHSHVQDSVQAIVDNRPATFGARCKAALRYGFVDLVASIGSWLVIGLIIAALITVYVPADFFAVLGSAPLLSMIAVLIIAIPMYVCATGSIPIALSLMLKGLSPGTAFVLLMAGPAANFASFTLISREMGRRAAIVYLTSIVIGALSIGLIIDYLLPANWFAVGSGSFATHHHHFAWFPTLCSAILVVLLIYSFIKQKFNNAQIKESEMTEQYIISGMNCPHCQAAVTRAISGVVGVNNVQVDLKGGIATIEGSPLPTSVIEAVRAAGFDAQKK